jgi:protein phosphatase
VDQLTFDHSLEWELERQHGNLEGLIDISQHKNVITRSLGPERVIDVDIEGPYPVIPGDAFLLCSDGLSNQISDAEIGAIVRELPPAQAVRLLIHLANIRGGPDNITAVVARVGDLPANIVPAPAEALVDDAAGLGWFWLIAFAIGALTLVAGLALQWTGHQIPGSILTALSVSSLVALGAAAFRQRKILEKTIGDDSKTQVWRPHRTAVGLSSKDLLDLLAQIDIDLQRSAREDGWEVNWSEHDQAASAAQQAAREKRYAKGIRDLARAIGIIMDELPRRGGGAKNGASQAG